MTLLDVCDLTIAVPVAGGARVPVVSGISLALERGETLGLVGESGSGKSMTALACAGLLPDVARATGTLRFDGQDILTASEDTLCALRGRRIGMVFQEPMTALNPLMSIGAQIAEPLRLHLRLSRAEAELRAMHLMDRVGLRAPRVTPHHYPHLLSGGQRQRVMIAIALACDPDLLIADEPTTALDVTVQAQILDLIGDLVRERGMALLLITHDLGVVDRTTRRVMVMYAGRVVEQGLTSSVFARPAHPYTRALFAASPHLAAGNRLPAIAGQVPEPESRPAGCAFAERCPRAHAACTAVPALRGIAPDQEVACFDPHLDPPYVHS
jgi:peptide/nickel transport system ATP-binding protein